MSSDIKAAVAGYRAPVDRLLTLGVIPPGVGSDSWMDYSDLGFSNDTIPDLIRMATDPSLHILTHPDPALYAPVHAWRVLAQMRAVEAAEPILSILDIEEDDWALEELSDIYRMLGPEALPALEKYAVNHEKSLYNRVQTYDAMLAVAEAFPDARQQVNDLILSQLSRYQEENEEFNAFLIEHLVDRKWKEAVPLIREMYENGFVDQQVCGSLEDVLIRMGVQPPTLEYIERLQRHREELQETLNVYQAKLKALEKQEQALRTTQKKIKEKRKAEKMARRKNRRK